MAKTNNAVVATIIAEVTQEQAQVLEQWANAQGFDFVLGTKDAGLNLPDLASTTTAKPSRKTTSKPKASAKKSDGFDHDKYVAVGKALGCLRTNGTSVYKCCRDVVYAVMDGEMTQAQGKREAKAAMKAAGIC